MGQIKEENKKKAIKLDLNIQSKFRIIGNTKEGFQVQKRYWYWPAWFVFGDFNSIVECDDQISKDRGIEIQTYIIDVGTTEL